MSRKAFLFILAASISLGSAFAAGIWLMSNAWHSKPNPALNGESHLRSVYLHHRLGDSSTLFELYNYQIEYSRSHIYSILLKYKFIPHEKYDDAKAWVDKLVKHILLDYYNATQACVEFITPRIQDHRHPNLRGPSIEIAEYITSLVPDEAYHQGSSEAVDGDSTEVYTLNTLPSATRVYHWCQQEWTRAERMGRPIPEHGLAMASRAARHLGISVQQADLLYTIGALESYGLNVPSEYRIRLQNTLR